MWYGPNVAVILIYLFYLVMYVYIDSHILRIRSDTVVVHRRLTMVPVINGSLTIPGDECGPKFPDICLTVEEKPPIKPQPGNWPDRESNPVALDERQRPLPNLVGNATTLPPSGCGCPIVYVDIQKIYWDNRTHYTIIQSTVWYNTQLTNDSLTTVIVFRCRNYTDSFF